MWIPKTASAELDIFPNAEVEGRLGKIPYFFFETFPKNILLKNKITLYLVTWKDKYMHYNSIS